MIFVFSIRSGSVNSETRIEYAAGDSRLTRNESKGRCAHRSEVSATLGPMEAEKVGVRPMMTLAA